MDGVSEINRSGTARQVLNIAGRGETIHMLSEQVKVCLNEVHELLIIICISLPLKDLAEP